jgi:hypothetical protein
LAKKRISLSYLQRPVQIGAKYRFELGCMKTVFTTNLGVMQGRGRDHLDPILPVETGPLDDNALCRRRKIGV